MKEYAFDVSITGAIRVRAESIEEARDLLLEYVDAADTNFGAWPDGRPILGEVTVTEVADEPYWTDEVEE